MTGDVNVLSAEGTIGAYNNGDEFHYGFDASASLAEASAKFNLFNIETENKSIFAVSAEPKVSGGAGAVASISGQSVYEDVLGADWFDVDAVTFKIGGKALIGADVSITIPWPDFNF